MDAEEAEQAKPEQKQLMPSPQNGSVPAIENVKPVDTAESSKQELTKFIDSLHKKASLATTWVSSLEPPNVEKPNDKQKKLFRLDLFKSFSQLFLLTVLNDSTKCISPIVNHIN